MSKSFFRAILLILISVGISGLLFHKSNSVVTPKAETALTRVLRTRTIRCGYYVYPPVTYKDPNTGRLSGLSVDMMEKIAKRADLKVEWAQEVNFGDWMEGLKTKRYDMACTPMWPSTALGQVVYFSKPFFYAGIYPIGRSNETRFKTLDDLNKPSVTVAAQEGNDTYFLAKNVFPNAKLISLPANANGNLVSQDVMTGKADFILLDKNFLNEFNSANPNALKILVDQPVKQTPFTLAVGVGEDELLQFANTAIDELLLTGDIDRLMQQWVKDPTVFEPIAPVYKH